MRPALDEIEIRVLGVLIEKSLTQAGTYPLTMNAIVLGANQKQNRDPVLELAESDVARALTRLQQKRLVKQAPPSAGARSNRFEHSCVDAFQWDRRQQAIMAEFFLRGRQTPGELRTHASRMTPFPDLEAIGNTLRELASSSPPFVEELSREPGRSANRWRQLLGGGDSTSGASAPATPEAATSTVDADRSGESIAAGVTQREARNMNDVCGVSMSDLERRVDRLEATLAEIASTVSELRIRVDALPRGSQG